MDKWLNQIIEGDCLEVMKDIPDKSVDLVLTDPPYNASNSKISCIDKHYTTVDEEWDKDFQIEPFIAEVKRILKPNGSLLVFCSYHLLGEYLTKTPLKLQQIIHWNKSNPFPAIVKVYTPSIEYCLWYIVGSPYTFNKTEAGTDVFKLPICGGRERTEHPTQKPLLLIEKLIAVHSNRGDTILDPFLGSGTTAIAAHNTGRFFIGIEKEPKYVEIARQRVEQAQAQQSLFGGDAL